MTLDSLIAAGYTRAEAVALLRPHLSVPLLTKSSDTAQIHQFCSQWRQRLLQRIDGRSEKLSQEEFGQLVTLNTVIYYIENLR